MSAPELIGEPEFIRKLSGEPISGAEQVSVQTNAEGNVIGDTAHIPPEILAQLQSPQAQAQIRKLHEAYKESGKMPRSMRYAPELPREMRYINEREDRRNFVDTKPPGMTTREWRRIARRKLHKTHKAVLKAQRSIRDGERPESNESAAG